MSSSPGSAAGSGPGRSPGTGLACQAAIGEVAKAPMAQAEPKHVTVYRTRVGGHMSLQFMGAG
jgi:hypothetical protein